MDKVKDFFTVKNSLIVIICLLVVILIFQNVHRYGGHQYHRNSGGSVTSSRGMGLPGMGGGMMGGGYAGRRGGN